MSVSLLERHTSTPLLAPELLFPALRPHNVSTRPRLSEDGFFDSVATVGLCAGHDMQLRCGTGLTELGESPAVGVSLRALSEWDMTVNQAWTTAAHNVLRAAHTSRGYRFQSRPARDVLDTRAHGVQVRSPGVPITAWLTHPLTFNILHEHFAAELGVAPSARRAQPKLGSGYAGRHIHGGLVYLAPAPDVLFIFRGLAAHHADGLHSRATAFAGLRLPSTALAPLLWCHGFPRVLPGTSLG
ncbi:hypothetical protein [Corynebacterium sp. SA-MJD20WY100]|uniref:hypothetical protein n=1 Tax=Corynebacterium sp. SA-MJD20WY100 TaxID=3142969 RepID=UPI0032216237